MPRRTNDFQTLIALIESQLHPAGALVTESKLVRDRDGIEREIDVHVHTESGGHPVRLAVECIDRRRPADVSWVDQILGKYQRLPVHKVILVSRAGFTKEAAHKALAFNMEPLTLREAEAADWVKVVDRLRVIVTDGYIEPFASRITIVFASNPSGSAQPPADLGDPSALDLSGPGGEPAGTIGSYVRRFLTRPEFEQVRYLMPSGTNGLLRFTIPFNPGVYVVDHAGEKHGVDSLSVEAKCRRELCAIVLERHAYADAQVAIGIGETFEQRLTFSAVERPGQVASFALALRPKTSPGPRPKRPRRKRGQRDRRPSG